MEGLGELLIVFPLFRYEIAHADMFGLQGFQDDQRVGYLTVKVWIISFTQKRAAIITIRRDAYQICCSYW